MSAFVERPVVVVGGGLAGLTAAARIARGGRAVTLLESRPRLGGRATSFEDAASGDLVDNCQHVGMGCCTALQQFCREAGLGDLFRIERELTFIDAQGRRSRFAAARLPAPLHLAPSFARLRYLRWRDRRAIARGLRELAREQSVTSESFEDWLVRHRQPEPARRLFWHVVLVSALSETLDRIDVQAARKVFVDGFLSNATGFELHLPTRPLDDLYGPPMQRYLESLGVVVKTNTAVERLIPGEENRSRFTGVRLRNGDDVPASSVVLAVPWHRLGSLLEASGVDRESDEASALLTAGNLEHAPIASVHLWFERPIMTLPHAVLVDHLSQWVFARPPHAEGSLGHYYQVVISASRDVLAQPREQTIAHVLNELRSVFSDAVDNDVLRSRLVVEKRAVFSVRPGSDALRPAQRTAFANLFLAGDYTQTGWPATMEGAVRSGELAAAALLGTDPMIPPDLPRGRLAKWFIGRAAVSPA